MQLQLTWHARFGKRFFEISINNLDRIARVKMCCEYAIRHVSRPRTNVGTTARKEKKCHVYVLLCTLKYLRFFVYVCLSDCLSVCPQVFYIDQNICPVDRYFGLHRNSMGRPRPVQIGSSLVESQLYKQLQKYTICLLLNKLSLRDCFLPLFTQIF